MAGRQSEDTDVHQNSEVDVRWFQFNMPSIVAMLVAVLGTGWAVASYIATLEARVEKIEEYRVTRSAITDGKFADIQATLGTLNNMPYRVNILEQQATAINIRIDRFTEVISNTMELIRKDVATLGTKVEVMSNKIDNLSPAKKAGLGAPPELIR